MRVSHLGHSCLLVEVAATRLLIDPGSFSPSAAGATDLDAVLITHAHPDHMDIALLRTVLETNPGVPVLAEPGAAAVLTEEEIPARTLTPGRTATAGAATVHAVGGLHADIHPEIPRIGNVGLVVTADGEPTLFHPGDDLDTVPTPETAPDGVDLLTLPIAGPWVTIPAAVGLLRAVLPRAWAPVHDAVLSPAGRSLFLHILGTLAPDGSRLLDLAGAGPTEV
jgi:L-ascorbate metabolism protein UlaG (beta-lactamase superfamily)